MGTAVTKRNYYKEDPSQTTTTVTVEPSEENKSTSLSMPTDPALQQELQRQIQAAQRAYGVNPQTGAVTPFEALGYNPEDERKRREAERALNDRKRKENAWYNAFAVLGDSLTAALGGNVWQRQPNNIGAKANADNARLIAEQKAEDEGNAAKLRAAGTAYANTVNQLLQNYLTKTTNTTTSGGSRKETTHHPEISKTRQVAFPLGDANGGNGSGSGSGSGKGGKYVNIDVTQNGKKIRNRYDVSQKQYDALIGILKERYNNILSKNDDKSQQLIDYLTGAHVIKGTDAQGQYIYDDNQLLQNGSFWMLDDATRDRIEREVPGIKFKRGWGKVEKTPVKDF